jgi:hypothetical protein
MLSARAEVVNDGCAVAVARETMKRTRANLEILVDLLDRHGYVFDSSPDGYVLAPPEADAVVRLDELESRVGAIPLALRCWYEEVGGINLVGSHPDWQYALSDPLVVDAPIDFVQSWESDRGTEWDQGPFTIGIAPDDLHKANISGGPP